MRQACAAGLAVITICCAPAATPATLDQIAERYVRVALQLAQHTPDLVDDWRGPEAWKPGPREPVAVSVRQIDAVRKDLAAIAAPADPNRAGYLRDQLTALAAAAARLSGQSMTFDGELHESFPASQVAPVDLPGTAAARATLDQLLPGRDPLAARYTAYRTRLSVPPPKIEPVMRAALAACREASQSAMPLPADERIDLVFGHGSQWDGSARYLGGHHTRIEINLDAPVDVTRALRLACHEGYPGHHAQFVLIDDELVKRRGWMEFALAPSFGRHLLIAEGAAEAGVDLAFPPAKRLELYKNVMLPAAGLPATEADRLVAVENQIAVLEPIIADVSRAYLDNTLTQANAIDRLRAEALTPDPEALLAFAERRRSRIMAYPAGRSAIRQSIGNSGIAGLRHLFTDTPFTLAVH